MKEIPWKTTSKKTHVISEAVSCLNIYIHTFLSIIYKILLLKWLELNAKNEEKLREQDFFSIVKKRLREDLITIFQYLKGTYKENGDSPFTRSHMAKARDKGVQMIPGKISFHFI